MTRVIFKTTEGKRLVDTNLDIIPRTGELFKDEAEDEAYMVKCVLHRFYNNKMTIVIFVENIPEYKMCRNAMEGVNNNEN